LIDALLSSAPWWAWLGFHLLVLVMLSLDLGIFNRTAHAPSVREAAWWSTVWILLSLLFNGVIWKTMGSLKAAEFFTGYLLEKSLSVDNLFVFVLLFTAFQVPSRNQHRVLYWGVVGAMILRASMIAAGITLLNRFSWMMLLFGGFLVYTGVKMMVFREKEPADPKRGAIAKVFRSVVPYDPEGGFERFWVAKRRMYYATPMLLLLVIVEATDLLFAVDSIPAVLAVTRDPFIVYTSNIFAILGLRSLYFLLARMMDRFHWLKAGLAIILTFVGVKMCLARLVEIPIAASLLVITLVLMVCVGGSMIWPQAKGGAAQ
jgi:tellurite resistance protein TerC